tara:strand:+ start:14078 stop:14767 length:690 start_codon:yes stop_codon:yes gene_type:complete
MNNILNISQAISEMSKRVKLGTLSNDHLETFKEIYKKNPDMFARKRNACIFMQGIPGSGKSYQANILRDIFTLTHNEVLICSADDFWGPDYNFDIKNISKAHGYCFNKFAAFVDNTHAANPSLTKVVIIDNTNIKKADIKIYATYINRFNFKAPNCRFSYNYYMAHSRSVWWRELYDRYLVRNHIADRIPNSILSKYYTRNIHNVPKDVINSMINKWHNFDERDIKKLY